MRAYRRKFQIEYMSSDLKPKGRTLKKIQSSIRQAGKREIRTNLKDLDRRKNDGEFSS